MGAVAFSVFWGFPVAGESKMRFRNILTCAAITVAVAAATPANAGAVLIVNGASGTSEPGTTASITTQLTNLHTAAGNVVTVSDGIPLDLSPYAQVWDLRFSNSAALAAPDIAEYLSYLQGGGGMFVMGENSGFATRNNSVLALIAAAGGGTLTFTTPNATQTVVAPFTGPNPVASLFYLAPGGVTSAGTGQFITTDGSAGTGVAFGVGTLTNAPAGALTSIFDVNFLQTDANAQSQALAANLVRFVGQQVNPGGGVPEPSTWAMMLLGFGAIGLTVRRRREQELPEAA